MEFEVTFKGKKQVLAHMGEHTILTDQPAYGGGNNEGPAPFSLFLASIGTCAGIYVKAFCDQRGIPTDKVKIVQKHKFNELTHMIDDLQLEIQLPADFPEKYRDAVVKAADQCAVKKHLHHPPSMSVTTKTV